MAVNDILEIGRQGLTTNRQALQTTSNNISNANTPGYTRRRVVLGSNPPAPQNGLNLGSGVSVKDVVRIHDDFVHGQLVGENQSLGGLKARAESLDHLESMVSKDAQFLGELTNKFFNDMRELSLSPQTSTLRNMAAGSASALADGFHKANESLEGMRRDLDLRIGNSIEQVNTYTRELAKVNNTITEAEARGETPNDLYDQRDQILRDLSQKINFQMTTDQYGQVNLVSGGTVLVQGNASNDLFVLRTPESNEKGPGSVDIFAKDQGNGRKITHGITDGELGGMMYVRDKVIGSALNHLDQIAYQLGTSVNKIHRDGVGADGDGNRNLFVEPTSEHGAAHSFALNEDIKNNFENLAVGLSKESPGDNNIPLRIADLQNSKMLPTTRLGEKDHHTINESINSLVGNIGMEAQKSQSFYQQQQGVVDQLDNYRQSLSGVSLEEEAVNMMQYQTVFNASAKAMKVGEELFDTILKLKE